MGSPYSEGRYVAASCRVTALLITEAQRIRASLGGVWADVFGRSQAFPSLALTDMDPRYRHPCTLNLRP